MSKGYFLPYQKRWLNDKSQIKIWEKSRRIGATYTQSYEDVEDALTLIIRGKPCDVWFSSADESAAQEYILYCEMWAKMFNAGAKSLGEVVIDEEKGIKAFSLEFQNGARINALSSNPTRFRSKGGKVVLDEFAHHKQDAAMWTAASPSALIWGYPLRILSTHNGIACKYYQFIDDIKKGKLKWGLHSTPIQLAVQEGLADKVLDRELTEQERQEWLQMIKENAGDELTWNQEYCCIPIDEASAFFSYDMLNSIKENNVGISPNWYLEPKFPEDVPDEIFARIISLINCEFFLGYDVGRKKDFSILTILEKAGTQKYLRLMIKMNQWRFRDQKRLLYKFLGLPNLRRARIDSTGIGAQLGEDAQIDFGMFKVEPITFTNAVKEEMAYIFYTEVEDRNFKIDTTTPQEVINDFHSIKKFETKSHNIRFDSDGSTDGHADRFWSCALALSAAADKNGFKNPEVYTNHNLIKQYRPSLQMTGFGR